MKKSMDCFDQWLKTVQRFLDCGIYHNGFARVRCTVCHHEYLLAFSCKTRYFCPSCQSKRVAAFVEWVTIEILEPVDHRQMVWTIPKVLRTTFRRERRLLGELVRCAWKTLQENTRGRLDLEATCGAVFAIQTWGDQLNFLPHLQSLVSDTAWDRDGNVLFIGQLDSGTLTQLFRHHVLEMLAREHRLSPEFVHKLRSWHHSGFQVWVGRTRPARGQKVFGPALYLYPQTQFCFHMAGSNTSVSGRYPESLASKVNSD